MTAVTLIFPQAYQHKDWTFGNGSTKLCDQHKNENPLVTENLNPILSSQFELFNWTIELINKGNNFSWRDIPLDEEPQISYQSRKFCRNKVATLINKCEKNRIRRNTSRISCLIPPKCQQTCRVCCRFSSPNFHDEANKQKERNCHQI